MIGNDIPEVPLHETARGTAALSTFLGADGERTGCFRLHLALVGCIRTDVTPVCAMREITV